MKIVKYIITFTLLVFLQFSCSDFLDKEPLSEGTESIAFKTKEHFKQAANALYNLEGWKDYNGLASYYKMDKNLDISGLISNGGASAKDGDEWHSRWDRTYGYIRNCNILLSKAEAYDGSRDEIKEAVGTAYFFRAWQHFYLMQKFGGIPIVNKVLDVDDDNILYGPRSSRYETAHFIFSDLRTAIELLPKHKNIAAADEGKVSQEAAKAFLARVLLYEATWEKYTSSDKIGFDLDGDGVESGAGKAKPTDYPSVEDMLTEAKAMAGEVITEAETGTFALWQECDSLSYYYLFNIDDTGGNISNFMNKGKATNKEFIFKVKYDFVLKQGGINLTHTVMTGQAISISGIFGESFLCRNGLPIYISHDGVTREKNPDFKGFNGFYDEYRNRDYRFIGSIFMPDRPVWSARPQDGGSLTAIGEPYPSPVYPAEPWNRNDPNLKDPHVITIPVLRNNTNYDTYSSRKFNHEGANRSTNNQESADYPLIRLAEVHLIYAEATVELGEGSISDADLNFSINKNRMRAGVAPLTNALIAGVYDAGYWDHTQNKTIIKQMNMLDEIRRERACELFGEGFRMDDLKRWGIAHINLVGRKLGRRVLGTAYETAIPNDRNWGTGGQKGEFAYFPSKYPLKYGVFGDGEKGGSVDVTDLDYGRSIATDPGNLLFTQRDYLAPIPVAQIRLNDSLIQNPGW